VQDWEKFAREAAPGKQLKLSPDPLDCIGGVLVISAGHDIRFNNTFEGRMERMEETLQGALAERLTPQSGEEQHG
jgi:V/A-type H+-transporting ATPase subunit E